jgi:hypothetical protein
MRSLLVLAVTAIAFGASAEDKIIDTLLPGSDGIAGSKGAAYLIAATSSLKGKGGGKPVPVEPPPPPPPSVLSARDQGNGEVLLEWPPQTNASGYRVERTATGVPTVSLDAGSSTNTMDFAGLADTYSYRLLARNAAGTEWMVSTLSYTPPVAVRMRATQAAGRPPQLRSALGTNLEGVAAWTSEVPFLNVMKSSTVWISGDSTHWDNGQALDLDANGWVRSLAPGQVAKKLMLREIGTNYPAGQYRVTYKGEGTLVFQFAARVVSQQAGEVLIQVTPQAGGIYLGIEATNPSNYLRDIEIIMPGGICEGNPFMHVNVALDCGQQRFLSFAQYHSSLLFYPVFADRLRAYSVLRFMDWMATNGSIVTNSLQRTPLSFHTWATPTGVPVEVMIALANRVGAHPWFNMPHQSDDAYAVNFAQTVKARLDAALGVYAEYSNEVWNGMFLQYAYAVKQGSAQQPAIDNMQYYALRSRGVGRIFKDTLGAPRTVAVLGGQAVNPWTATHGLDYLISRFGAGQTAIDAIVIAPYFGVTPNPAEAATYTAMTMDAFFDYVRTQILPRTVTDSAKYRAVANSYGVRLISYEGGQHMVGVLGAENDTALNALFDAFNRDARIKQLYLSYLAGWKQAGGELFVHFNDVGRVSKWGRWGALEYVAQPRAAAPKFDAIQSFIEQNPVWWAQ